uniref:Response regulator n=1 Tax=Desulfobacca acetoxidans TaxID=60893 RepID=A0A7C3SJN6_9BACT
MGEPCKILVADRNRHVRDLLRRELQEEGYSVQVARDGHEVWLMLNSASPPDLVILDPDIPYLEDLTKQAESRKGKPFVPLIIFSFLPEEEDRTIPGAVAVLEKKEDTQRLKDLVAEVIRQYYPAGKKASHP